MKLLMIESGDVLSRYINPSREKYIELYGV